MEKTFLVVGSNSKIGRYLIPALENRGDIVYKTSRRKDEYGALWLDFLELDSFFQNNPPAVDIVVLCAGKTKFEDCRNFDRNVYEINVDGPVRVASFYAKKGAKIIQLSTNAVFNGERPFVSDLTIPNGVTGYGCLKAEVESQLINLNSRVSILRFSKIITPIENIFFSWLQCLQKGEKINAFKDQFISPVAVKLAISVILAVIDDDNGGIYQFSACGDISYFEIAQKMVRMCGFNEGLIYAESAAEIGIPKDEIFRYSSLDSSRIESLKIISPDPFSILNDII